MDLEDLTFRDCILHGRQHDCLGVRVPTRVQLVSMLDTEAAARLYADWHGTDWVDDDGMRVVRLQVRRLFAAAFEGDGYDDATSKDTFADS